jgi:hypothetical protein
VKEKIYFSLRIEQVHIVTVVVSAIAAAIGMLDGTIKKVQGIIHNYFGSTITFAAKAYWHTVQQLGETARDPNAGMRRFTKSLLVRSWDMCLLFCGVLVSRADNPSNGFVF